ncbi:MAG TPA: hypothetical protein VLM89_10615 [Phycisphaerae bacterium]|nr:hypothetical protein [Phycisphaerae bacterium]
MSTDYSERIEQLVNGPKSVTQADGRSVTTQDIEAVIAAEDRVASKTAATRNHFGLRFVRPYNCGPAGFQ